MRTLRRFARNPHMPLEAQLLVGMVAGIVTAALHSAL
jgi:hypothetical protein